MLLLLLHIAQQNPVNFFFSKTKTSIWIFIYLSYDIPACLKSFTDAKGLSVLNLRCKHSHFSYVNILKVNAPKKIKTDNVMAKQEKTAKMTNNNIKNRTQDNTIS